MEEGYEKLSEAIWQQAVEDIVTSAKEIVSCRKKLKLAEERYLNNERKLKEGFEFLKGDVITNLCRVNPQWLIDKLVDQELVFKEALRKPIKPMKSVPKKKIANIMKKTKVILGDDEDLNKLTPVGKLILLEKLIQYIFK